VSLGGPTPLPCSRAADGRCRPPFDRHNRVPTLNKHQALNGRLIWRPCPPLGGEADIRRGWTPPKSDKGPESEAPAAKAEPAGATPAEPKGGAEKRTPKEGREEKGEKSNKGKGGFQGSKASAEKKSGPPEKKTKKVSDNPNFRYIVRVANTDLDGTRPTVMALTKIPGVGVRIAEATARVMGLSAAGYIGDLTEEQTEAIETTILSISQKLPPWMLNHPSDRTTGETRHLVSADWETSVRDDVNTMKMIRCYKGIRHERGQKVRGQRTRSNGRTGMATGVLKKTAKEQAAAAGKGEKEEKKK
jgi:small subunit ribosomal protein S13